MEFSSQQLAKILFKTLRFVQDWEDRGLFQADIQPAAGPGSKRRYSYNGVLQAALAVFLKDTLQCSRGFIRHIISQLGDLGGRDWTKTTLVIMHPGIGQPSIGILYPDEIGKAMRLCEVKGAAVTFVNLGEIKEFVDFQIKQLG